MGGDAPEFFGRGGCTRFYPVGKMDCVLDFNGICNCEIGRFIIEGHNNDEESIENAIQYRWDGQVGRSSASNHFHDISVLGTRCVTGFRIGEPNSGVQCDTTSYNNIVLQGNYPNDKKWWKYGFYVGTDWFGNCLEHWFRDINVTHWDEGYHVSVTNFALDNANFGGNGTDVVAHTLSYFRMQGIRSELSNRFLVSGTGASSSSANFSISDVLFWTDSLAKDGQIIQFKQNGTLYLRNFVISPERKPNILVQPYKYCSLIMDGVTCSSTREEFTKNTNDRVVISAKGFITEYQNGQGFLSGVDYHS